MNKTQFNKLQRMVSSGLILATAFLLSPVGQAEDHETSGKHSDQTFIKEAAQGGLMEVQAGQLAQRQGQSSEIKQLGQRLAQDHSKANAELMQIAQTKGITLEKTLDAKHKTHLQELSAKQGAEFDKTFAKQALKHHKKSISKFEKASEQSQDLQLKGFAQKTIPVLREHLRMAQSAARAVGLEQQEITAALQESDEAQGKAASDVETKAESGTDQQQPKQQQPERDSTESTTPKSADQPDQK
jgi:putative membrane protein